MLNLRWEVLRRGSLAGINQNQILLHGQLAVLKHNCRTTLEHGGKRCMNIEKGDSPLSWRKRQKGVWTRGVTPTDAHRLTYLFSAFF